MVSRTALTKMSRVRDEISISDTLGYFEAMHVLKKSAEEMGSLPYSSGFFFKAKEDIRVFKALADQHEERRYIANLIIPRGTLIHIGGASVRVYYKCRAEKALVHSIIDKYTGNKVTKAYSIHMDPERFKRMQYRTGELIDLTEEFDLEAGTCAAGLHFFLDIKSALLYGN